MPLRSSLPIFLGIERGYFKDEGFEVVPRRTAVLNTRFEVASHAADLAYTSIPVAVAGRSNGLPIKVVGSAGGWSPDPDRCTLQLLVGQTSDLAEPKQLERRVVAIDRLGQLPHVSLAVSAGRRGLDVTALRFREMGFANMEEALRSGEVDAVDVGEPHLTRMRLHGARRLLSNSEGFAPHTDHAVWITSDSFAARADAAARLARALRRCNRHAREHPAETREAMARGMEAPSELIDRMTVPDFHETVERTNFPVYVEAMRSLGMMWKELDVGSLFTD